MSDLDLLQPRGLADHLLDNAIETAPSRLIGGSGGSLVLSGTKLTFFRAQRAITVTRMLFNLAGTNGVAGATPHARVGFMAWDPATGTVTPLIESADDPTMLTAGTFSEVVRGASVARGLPASFDSVPGAWYAFAMLMSGFTTAPSVTTAGINFSSATHARSPRVCASITLGGGAGQWNDLPIAPQQPTLVNTANPTWAAGLNAQAA